MRADRSSHPLPSAPMTPQAGPSPEIRAFRSAGAGTDEMFVVRHLLPHGASWRSVYLQGIDSSEIISTVHGRPSPTISATVGLEMTR
jgi:hypothetical protein